MVCESYSKKSSNLDKLKATKDFLAVLEKNGNSKQMAESFLSPEQKELLEEDKFVQAQKKKYGRAEEPTATEKAEGLKKLLAEWAQKEGKIILDPPFLLSAQKSNTWGFDSNFKRRETKMVCSFLGSW